MTCKDFGSTEIFDFSTLIAVKKHRYSLELMFTSGLMMLEYDTEYIYAKDDVESDYNEIIAIKKKMS